MRVLGFLIFLSCFLFIPATSQGVRTDGDCALFLGQLAGHVFKGVLHLPVPFTVYDKRMHFGYLPLKETGDFYDPSAVYIGIANLPRLDGFHHYYVIAKNFRLDAMPGKPAHLHDSAGGAPPVITQGMVFKVNTPLETQEKMVQEMKKKEGEIYPTCLHPVIEVLNESGILVAPNAQGQNQLSTAQVSTGLLSGEVTKNGLPLKVEAFATSAEQLSLFLVNAMNQDALTKAKIERELQRAQKSFPLINPE